MKFATISIILALGFSTGCDKPTEESCRAALVNIQRLLGTDIMTTASTSLVSEVRRCRGASSRSAVKCAADATTLEQLEKCEFYRELTASDGSAAAPGK